MSMNRENLELIGLLQEHSDCLNTIKQTSLDSTNREYMTDSLMNVINFDLLTKQRYKNLHLSCCPSSVDALYVNITDDGHSLYLIEFKNGKIDEHQISRKIYNSLILLFDRKVITDLSDSVKKLDFILVYNSERFEKDQKDNLFRCMIGETLNKLAGTSKIFNFLNRFKKYIFKDTHTYSQDEFHHKFILQHSVGEK